MDCPHAFLPYKRTMNRRRLGSSGPEVSVIGIGNMTWPHCYYGKTPPPGAAEAVDRKEIIQIVSSALDHGVTLFDTAEGYGRGFAETLLGDALQAMGRRGEVTLVTKVGPLFAEEQVGGRSCNLSSAHIRQRCEGSLRRLRVETIDLYLAHHPDPLTPVAETIGTFVELQREGKIAHFGVSNFGVPLLTEVLRHGAVVADQLPYSLIQRDIDAALRPFCAEKGVGIMAFSALGKGILSGKYDAAHLPPPGDYRYDRFQFGAENLQRHLAIAARCRELADGLGITSGQLALAWALAQPGIGLVLAGAREPDQIAASARAGSIVLPEETLVELDRLTLPSS